MKTLIATLYVTLLLISNTIPNKIWAGLPWVGPMTVGVWCFPFVYVLGDVMAEVYGWRFAKNMVWTAYLCNFVMVGFYALTIMLPAAPFMTPEAVNAYKIVLGAAPRVLLASIVAYPVGSLVNARILVVMKDALPPSLKADPLRRWLRFMVGTVLGEGVDVAIFMPGAFLGIIPGAELGRMMIAYWIFKCVYEAAVSPVSTWISARMLGRTVAYVD